MVIELLPCLKIHHNHCMKHCYPDFRQAISGKTITLDADSSESIESVKTKIQDQESVGQQRFNCGNYTEGGK